MKQVISLALIYSMVLVTLISCQNNETALNQSQTQNENQTENTPTKACSKDLKICPNEQKVNRDPNNNCEFFPCPSPLEVTACPEDVKQCADGSFVTRDQSQFCEFKVCPETSIDANNNKESTKPPVRKACTKDLKICPNGRSVSRNPLNNCEFHTCRPLADNNEPLLCTQDVKQCADGSFVGRDPAKNCTFKPCINGDETNTTH